MCVFILKTHDTKSPSFLSLSLFSIFPRIPLFLDDPLSGICPFVLENFVRFPNECFENTESKRNMERPSVTRHQFARGYRELNCDRVASAASGNRTSEMQTVNLPSCRLVRTITRIRSSKHRTTRIRENAKITVYDKTNFTDKSMDASSGTSESIAFATSRRCRFLFPLSRRYCTFFQLAFATR